MTTETSPAVERVQQYLDRRAKATRIDTEEIHAFDIGADTEVTLCLSDLRAILGRLRTAEDLLRAGAAKVPEKLGVPVFDSCDIDYSCGHQVGYADGWNDCVDALTTPPAPDAGVVEPKGRCMACAVRDAAIGAQPDQTVTPAYLEWLGAKSRSAGVGGNEAWNAGVAWAQQKGTQ